MEFTRRRMRKLFPTADDYSIEHLARDEYSMLSRVNRLVKAGYRW